MTTYAQALAICNYHTRRTNALLNAVDVARVALWPWLPALARTAAKGADDQDLDIGLRLELRQELSRLMEKLSGYSWHLERDVQRRRDALAAQDEREFWLDTWALLDKWAPDAALFEMFTQDDLLDELGRDEESE
jgi:hypothetical protein